MVSSLWCLLCFFYAAIQALQKYDGKRDSGLGKRQEEYFTKHIKGSPEHTIICEERNAVAHAGYRVAYHPKWPKDVIERHGGIGAGFETFPPPWPDGDFKGYPLAVVVKHLLHTANQWIAEIERKPEDLAD